MCICHNLDCITYVVNVKIIKSDTIPRTCDVHVRVTCTCDVHVGTLVLESCRIFDLPRLICIINIGSSHDAVMFKILGMVQAPNVIQK